MKTITKIYTADYPSLDLAACGNQELAKLINALEEADRDLKQICKMGRAKMLARIEKKAEELELDLGNGYYLHHIAIMGSFAAWLTVATAPVEKATKKAAEPKKEKGPSIRSVAEEILMRVAYHDEDNRPFGLPYEEVLAEIKKEFPNAKTTVACLRWYVVHMRDGGKKVPARPRVTKK